MGKYSSFFYKTIKTLKDPKLNINSATSLLASLQTFTESLRPYFDYFTCEVKEISGCENHSKQSRRKRKRNTPYDDGDAEDAQLDVSSELKTDAFLPIIDHILTALKKRTNTTIKQYQLDLVSYHICAM